MFMFSQTTFCYGSFALTLIVDNHMNSKSTLSTRRWMKSILNFGNELHDIPQYILISNVYLDYGYYTTKCGSDCKVLASNLL